MQFTLLAWLVLDLTDSPWLVALVGFFGFAPMFLLGLVGGMLADFADRRRLMLATQAAALLAALLILALLLSGSIEFWHAYPTMAVVGVAWALDMPSRRSLMHDLVGRSGVTNAIALDVLGMSVGISGGPALAGLLIDLVDVAWGYVVVALILVVSLALVLP